MASPNSQQQGAVPAALCACFDIHSLYVLWRLSIRLREAASSLEHPGPVPGLHPVSAQLLCWVLSACLDKDPGLSLVHSQSLSSVIRVQVGQQPLQNGPGLQGFWLGLCGA